MRHRHAYHSSAATQIDQSTDNQDSVAEDPNVAPVRLTIALSKVTSGARSFNASGRRAKSCPGRCGSSLIGNWSGLSGVGRYLFDNVRNRTYAENLL